MCMQEVIEAHVPQNQSQRRRMHVSSISLTTGKIVEELRFPMSVEELQREIDLLKKACASLKAQVDDQRSEIGFMVSTHASEINRVKSELSKSLSERNEYMYRLHDLQRDYAELWNLARENDLCGPGSALTGSQASALASSLLSENSNISLDSPDTPPETPAVCLRIIAEARKAKHEHQAYYNRLKHSTDHHSFACSRTPNPLMQSVRSRPSAPGPASPQPAMMKPVPQRPPLPRMGRRRSFGASDSSSPGIDALLNFSLHVVE